MSPITISSERREVKPHEHRFHNHPDSRHLRRDHVLQDEDGESLMARPLPVNLLMAGTGAVLLISGIGGESLGEVLQGQFGDITGKGQAAPAADSEGGGQMQNASDTEEGAPAASPGSFSSSTFAPSPTSLGRHNPSKQQQAQGIAAILIHKGITHPTNAQIETARQEYERKTGVVEYEQQVQEFYHGLPLV